MVSAKKKFQVVLRYDVEDFSLNQRTGLPELYSRKGKPFDQISLIKRLHPVLKRHRAKANFAVTYALLKRDISFLRPLMARGLGHLFTWHLHLKWDPAVQADWGKQRLPSCFLGHYKGKGLGRLLDMADGAFEKAFGYRPKFNTNACLSTSTELLRALEERGYLVQSDYSANTDYRVLEQILKYSFEGTRPFGGGPTAPCYPYAPDQPYRPNRADGMLAGDMGILAVPLTQLSAGMGLPHQDTYEDPDFEIEMIDRFYKSRHGHTVLVLVMHTHALMMGPGSAEENIDRNLHCLERVLSHLESLGGMEYANYLDVYRDYSRSFPTAPKDIITRDAGNGLLLYDGVSSAKYQSVGVGEPFLYDDPLFGPVSLAIGQDNGIAQWLIGGRTMIGPRIPDKSANKTYRRRALATTEAALNGKNLRLPGLNAESTPIDEGKAVGAKAVCRAEGLRIVTKYVFGRKMSELRLRTTVSGKAKNSAKIKHRYELDPSFKVLQRDSGSLVGRCKGLELRLSFPHAGARARKTADSYSILVNFEGPPYCSSCQVVD